MEICTLNISVVMMFHFVIIFLKYGPGVQDCEIWLRENKLNLEPLGVEIEYATSIVFFFLLLLLLFFFSKFSFGPKHVDFVSLAVCRKLLPVVQK